MRAGIWIVLCGLLTAGCAGYRLGPTGGHQAGATSLQINPFANQTVEPRLTDAVTSALRKRVQEDGTFRLNTRDDGDIILTGTLVEYDRSGLSYKPNDVITPRDFIVRLTAQVTVVQRSSGKVLLDRKVTGRTMVRILADLPSAERQAIPLAAEDLAQRAVSLLADGDW